MFKTFATSARVIKESGLLLTVKKIQNTFDTSKTETAPTGLLIRKLRRDKNLTQDKLGALLGIQASGVRKYESGTVIPPPDKLAKLAELFGVTTDYLLGRELSPLVAAVLKQPLTYALHNRIDELVRRTTVPQQARLLDKLDEWEKSL